MIGTTTGTLILHAGESAVQCEVDFTTRHEIANGQSISGTPTLAVLKNGVTSAHLTVSSATVSSNVVQFTVTVGASAVEGAEYEIKVTAVLSGGATLVECQRVVIGAC